RAAWFTAQRAAVGFRSPATSAASSARPSFRRRFAASLRADVNSSSGTPSRRSTSSATSGAYFREPGFVFERDGRFAEPEPLREERFLEPDARRDCADSRL